MGIAGYMVRNVVDGNRAKSNSILTRDEVERVVSGCVAHGSDAVIGLKVKRQAGRRRIESAKLESRCCARVHPPV